MNSTYTPAPLDTSHVELSPSLLALGERLAEHIHDVWSQGRIGDGWSYGPQRDDKLKHNPCLVPYPDLSDAEKEYDRRTAQQAIKAIVMLGYRIQEPATTE